MGGVDKRIKIVDKENGGPSSARNAGLNIASGEYIAFVDSDDWLSLNCYEKSIKRAVDTGADIVCYDIFEVFKSEVKCTSHLPKVSFINTFNSLDHLPTLFNMWPLVWAKLYKRSFIEKNKLRFIEGVLYEDNPFVLGCWIRNPKVTFVNDHIHYYRLFREGQITYGCNKRTKDIFTVIDETIKDFKKNNAKQEIKYLTNWIFRDVTWLYHKTPDDMKEEYICKMKQVFSLCLKNGAYRYKVMEIKKILKMLYIILTPTVVIRHSL